MSQPANMAKVLQALRLHGETLADLKEQMAKLTDDDKATLVRWYEEEQVVNAVAA